MSSKFTFPINYKAKYNSIDTYAFIDIFSVNFNKLIRQKYKGIYIPMPIIREYDSKVLVGSTQTRKIYFDNIYSNNIFAFNQNPVKFFQQKWNNLNLKENQTLFTRSLYINRDAKLDNTESIEKQVIYLFIPNEVSLEFDKNVDKISNLVLQIINEVLSLEDFDKYKIKNKIIKEFKTRDISLLWKKSVNLTQVVKNINDYAAKNGPVLLTNVNKQTTSEESELLFSDLALKNKAASLYVYDDLITKAIRLFKIKFLDSTNFENTNGQNVLVQIDLSNLFMYLLDKVHIAEVVSSAWDEDFIEFIQKNKMEIL